MKTLPQDIFENLIATNPNWEKSTVNKISHIYNFESHTLNVTYTAKKGLDTEEVCYYDGDEYIEYSLTKEQKDHLETILDEFYENYREEEADAEELARDPYKFYGTPRSFFL